LEMMALFLFIPAFQLIPTLAETACHALCVGIHLSGNKLSRNKQILTNHCLPMG